MSNLSHASFKYNMRQPVPHPPLDSVRSGLHSLSLCPSRHEEKNCLCYNKDHQRPTVSHSGHSDHKPRGENIRVERTAWYTDILTQTAALYRQKYRHVSAGITYRQNVPYILVFGRIYLSCFNSISVASVRDKGRKERRK